MVDSFAVSQGGDAPVIRVGDVLGKSFGLFAGRWAPFVGLALVAFAPRFVFELAVPQAGGAVFVTWLLQTACTSLADAAIIYGVVQELRGRGFTFQESLSAGFGRMGVVLGLSLGVGILVFLAAILLVIPGVIVATVYAVAIPVCVAERLGVGASMTRSGFLTRGNRWRIFGILLLVGIVTIVDLLPLRAVAAFVGGLRLEQVVAYLIEAAAGAFNAVVAGVLYYQLRVGKEGVDIERIAAVFD